MIDERPLEGRVAIVTGAGVGIGLAIANRLASSGAHVVINDIDEISARESKVTVQQAGREAVVVLGNVADPNTADAMVKAAWDHWGRLDILVNNASVTRDTTIDHMSDEWFALTLDVIVKGTFRCIRAAAPLMCGATQAERTAGKRVHRKIVNIASTAGIYGAAGKSCYAAAKAAVIGMTKAVAREWAPFLVNCNAVAPGMISPREQGPQTHNIVAENDRIQVPTQPDITSEYCTPGLNPGMPDLHPPSMTPTDAETLVKFARHVPLGRIGTPHDVAGAVAFLAGPDSDFITGAVLEVHGGMEFMDSV